MMATARTQDWVPLVADIAAPLKEDLARITASTPSPADGGLYGLHRGVATPFGRFQFVLGRELGVTWYGVGGTQQLITASVPGGLLMRFRSVSLELPILEYRPFRSFSASQSSTLLFQLSAGVDRPYGVRVESPLGATAPARRTVRWIGLRMSFDWRSHF